MATVKYLLSLMIAWFAILYSPHSVPQPDCETAEYIESINRGAIERVGHIKDKGAILLIALDPIWSEPEFEYEGYRDMFFISAIKQMRRKLVYAGIDEVVVWRLSQRGMGVAIPFKDGCAVSGYGEPDNLKKLMLMHKTFLLIVQHDLDSPTVRNGIKETMKASRYAPYLNDTMIDTVINNLKDANSKIGKSPPTPEEEATEFEADVKSQKISHELEPLKYAQEALARGDTESAYRLVEDGLISEYSEVKSKAHKFLEQNPELFAAAHHTFSTESLKESSNTYGDSAKELEYRRLSIYRTVAPTKDYTRALLNFENVFGKTD